MVRLSRRQFLTGSAAAFLTSLGLSGCGDRAPSTPSIDQVSVRILWTGDIHGQLRPIYHREIYDESFLERNGIEKGSPEAYVCSSADFLDLATQYGKVGGYARLATLIEQERSKFPDRTLLLDSGDNWYGSAIALLTKGRACVEVMNALGYDAMTLHWAFNLGRETMLARIDEAQFPVLAQNLVDTDFEDRVLPASMVKELGEVRVGVVGQAYPFSLMTTEDPELNPGWRMGYREAELQEEIHRLRQAEGVDLLVLLSHMGYPQDRAMAKRLSGVDVIVGGHTHDILWQPEQIGETLLVHGGSHGKFLGRLDLEIRDGKVVGYQHRLIPVLTERIEPDSSIDALISDLYQPYAEDLQKVIGEAGTVLYRRSTFGGSTDAFLTRAYREIMGADLACVGGWRFGTTLLPEPITVEDVYNAFKPTPSPLYSATLSGGVIRQLLEESLDNVFNPDPLLRFGGDVVRCVGNNKVELKKTAPHGERIVNMTIGGEPMQEDHKYQVATSGGRTQVLDPDREATSRPAVEELVRYIRDETPLVKADPVQVYEVVDG